MDKYQDIILNYLKFKIMIKNDNRNINIYYISKINK